MSDSATEASTSVPPVDPADIDNIKNCCALARCGNIRNLSACGACGVVKYCTKEHQTEHFKEGGHKMICPGRKTGSPLDFSACNAKASEHFSEKRYRTALPFYSAMLELTERALGILHPQIARLLEAMATCYKQIDKFDEASECLQRALLIKEVNNDQTPETSLELFNLTGRLAEYFVLAGKIDIGRQMMEKIEEETRSSFGESSFERGRALCSLAAVLARNADSLVDAEARLTEAISLDGYSKVTEPDRLEVASHGFMNLGTLLFEQNRFSDAIPHLSKALEMKIRATLPRDHPDIVALTEMIAKAKAGPA